MGDDYHVDFVSVFVIGVLCFIGGVLLGAVTVVNDMHNEAAKSGAGQWTINSQTGETTWQWTGATPAPSADQESPDAK